MRTCDLDTRRQRLIERFPNWRPYALGDWLGACADEHGDRPLVITDDRTLTYRETADQAARLADGLVALGVRPGEHVGVLMANYPEFVPVKFAIALAGAVAIPLNFLYRTEELAYVLARTVTKANWPDFPCFTATADTCDIRSAGCPTSSGRAISTRPPANMRRRSGTGGRKPRFEGCPIALQFGHDSSIFLDHACFFNLY